MEAMKNLDAIAATPGVDGVFIGPADLSASMGFVGQPNHPEVQAVIADAVRAHPEGRQGRAGILSTTEEQARKWLAAGATFVAVGVDTIVLAAAARSSPPSSGTAPPRPRPLPSSY